jgi:hypothetical protein
VDWVRKEPCMQLNCSTFCLGPWRSMP